MGERVVANYQNMRHVYQNAFLTAHERPTEEARNCWKLQLDEDISRSLSSC